MIERFEAGQSAPPVYFYCTRSTAEPERSRPNAVLSSVLRQLSCVEPDASILSPVIDKYKRQGEGFQSNGLDLDDSRDLIVRLVQDYSMTVIIVDALDECDPLLRQSLLDAFEYILKESVGLVKIFVSSRDDQDIVYTLREYPNMDISSDKNTADIKAYVETETQKMVGKGQLLRNSRRKAEMTALIIDQVSSGADGMFRWASLQLDVLRALKRDEDVRTQLGRIPPRLEQLYLEVYNNLVSIPGEFSRSIIENALKWLLCAKVESYASDFLIAVAANLDTNENVSMEDLLELCNNFVVYDQGLDVFRFAHLSVREYLEKRPEFAAVSCYSLAAECCLLQLIASSNYQNAEQLMSDEHLYRLSSSETHTHSSSGVGFLDHANNFWMAYSAAIPPNNRSDETNFGRTFRVFLSDKVESDSPLDSWVEWYCSRVPPYQDSEASVKFLEFLTRNSDSLSRSFFVATYYGFNEIVTSCVRDRRLGEKVKDQGLLLAAMAAQHETFGILSGDRETREMSESVLAHALGAFDKERLAWLLDKASETMITQQVFDAVAEDKDDGKMTILLDRYPGLEITEGMLDVALPYASLDNFKLLVARVATPVVTEKQLLAGSSLQPQQQAAHFEKIKIVLDKGGGSGLTPQQLAVAACFSHYSLIEELLKRCAVGSITETVMSEAVRRNWEIFNLLVQHGGKVTDAVLDSAASGGDAQLWQFLLEQGYAPRNNLRRLKLAMNKHFSDEAVVRLLLDHISDAISANDMASLIQEVVSNGTKDVMRLLLDRAGDFEISQNMLLAALSSVRPDPVGRVKMLLERSREVQITEDMLLIAAGENQDGTDLIEMLLDRECEVEISELVLMAAACNQINGCQIMQLFLAGDWAANLTGDVLICAAQYSSLDLVLDILERSEDKVNPKRLLEAAATNEGYGGKIVKWLLERAEIEVFPEDTFIEAVGNPRDGSKVILVLEETFGRINVTESLMAKCVHRATRNTIELLLSRTDPTQFTKEILIKALSARIGNEDDSVQRSVVENSLHIPVTIDILEVAAEFTSPEVFRFLWNRSNRSSVPENLSSAAAKGWNFETFKFLLLEVDCFKIGEETLIAIAANTGTAVYIFDLLIQRGLRAGTTEGVPETLLTNEGIKLQSSMPTMLHLSDDMRVTENLFRAAASRGDVMLIQSLSDFCELEQPPGKWLDIARLRYAVEYYDEDLLENLLDRGVELDVANPDGVTPLTGAAQFGNESAVKMLLAAGASPDGGPMSKSSPLCEAAEWGYYDIVRMLVNAGASINFRNHKGRTPSMIAKSNRHFRVFKYLEQCRVEQEGREREASKIT